MVERSVTRAWQKLADSRFGPKNLRVRIAGAREGSIEFDLLLIAGGGGLYKFFKDYPALKKGIKEFCEDIRHGTRQMQVLEAVSKPYFGPVESVG